MQSVRINSHARPTHQVESQPEQHKSLARKSLFFFPRKPDRVEQICHARFRSRAQSRACEAVSIVNIYVSRSLVETPKGVDKKFRKFDPLRHTCRMRIREKKKKKKKKTSLKMAILPFLEYT